MPSRSLTSPAIGYHRYGVGRGRNRWGLRRQLTRGHQGEFFDACGVVPDRDRIRYYRQPLGYGFVSYLIQSVTGPAVYRADRSFWPHPSATSCARRSGASPFVRVVVSCLAEVS